MMRKRLSVALVVFCLSFHATANADTVLVERYWPDYGIWVYYETDSSAYEVAVFVYCGFGCVTFQNLYGVPPLAN